MLFKVLRLYEVMKRMNIVRENDLPLSPEGTPTLRTGKKRKNQQRWRDSKHELGSRVTEQWEKRNRRHFNIDNSPKNYLFKMEERKWVKAGKEIR